MRRIDYKWVLRFITFYCLYAVSVEAVGMPPVQPAAFWPCERLVENSLILNAMRSGHNGSLRGARIVEAGYHGNALSFDGKDDSVSIEHAEKLLTGDSWSVSFWFRRFPQSPGGESRLRTIAKASANPAEPLCARIASRIINAPPHS